MKQFIARFVCEEQGQDLIEYALLAGLIAVLAITALTTLGTQINTTLGSVTTGLAS